MGHIAIKNGAQKIKTKQEKIKDETEIMKTNYKPPQTQHRQNVYVCYPGEEQQVNQVCYTKWRSNSWHSLHMV